MSKISLIIQREYLTRVRKRSFILMSIIGPLLFAGFMIIPAWLAKMEDKEVKTIAVIDSSKIFLLNPLPETQYIRFKYLHAARVEDVQKVLPESNYFGVLYIGEGILENPSSAAFYSFKQPSFNLVMHIKGAMEKEVERQKLLAYDIQNIDDIMASVKTNLNIQTIKWTSDGKSRRSYSDVSMAVGYAAGFMVYFFIFLFGAQVMRGVIEEKTNRIIEVIISSIRPFQLMMGKIIGIALVGLTQFVLWICLTLAFLTVAKATLMPKLNLNPVQQTSGHDIMGKSNVTSPTLPTEKPAVQEPNTFQNFYKAVQDINWTLMLLAFLFYFLGGYLLYAALFAAIGSAVDSETDTQQFMLPITIPLVLAIFVMINAIQNPEGPLAFWFSMIPLTSPIIMMVRIPFGVPIEQVIMSMALLIGSFILTTWLAAKIYRTGILMYGKKSSYRELVKWIRYKG